MGKSPYSPASKCIDASSNFLKSISARYNIMGYHGVIIISLTLLPEEVGQDFMECAFNNNNIIIAHRTIIIIMQCIIFADSAGWPGLRGHINSIAAYGWQTYSNQNLWPTSSAALLRTHFFRLSYGIQAAIMVQQLRPQVKWSENGGCVCYKLAYLFLCGGESSDKVCMEVWELSLSGMHSCNLLECVGMCVWSEGCVIYMLWSCAVDRMDMCTGIPYPISICKLPLSLSLSLSLFMLTHMN